MHGLTTPQCVVGLSQGFEVECRLKPRTSPLHVGAQVLYKEYPHVDSRERAAELFEIAAAAAEGKVGPSVRSDGAVPTLNAVQVCSPTLRAIY